MLDMWNLPEIAVSKLFLYQAGTATADWQPYIIPRGHQVVQIIAVGGGGGGGGGRSQATAGNRDGGGGGGAAAITRLTVLRVLLPEVVFVNVGAGGRGGDVNHSPTASTAGAQSYVSTVSNTTVANFLITFANGGGAGGSANGGGSGGAAGIVAIASGAFFHGMGLFTAIAGQAGTAGGNNAAATDVTWGATGIFVSGGAGGGGENAAGNGGNIIGDATFAMVPTIAGGTAAATGNPGGHGHSDLRRMFFTGGGGGGGSNATGALDGGPGGKGGLGCGGGGGGGGDASSTGNIGGNGGNGFVLISSW